MKKTPVSWRLFILFNYLLLICFAVIFISLCFFLSKNPVEPEGRITFFPFFAGSFFILVNSALSVLYFHRYYPDKPFSRKTAVLLWVQTLFYLLSIVALLLLVVLGVREEIISGAFDSTGILLLGFLFAALCICIYTFIFQLKLKRTIEKNYRKRFEKMIDTIGENKGD
jgi:hypothetical protein